MELEEKNLEQQQMQVLIEQVRQHQSSLDIANQEREKQLNEYIQENKFLKDRLQRYESHFLSINSKEAKIKHLLESNHLKIMKKDDINQELLLKVENLQSERDQAQLTAADLQRQLSSTQERLQRLSVTERAHTDTAELEKKRATDMSKQLGQLLKQTQEANNQRIHAEKALQSLQTMYNLNKDEC